MEKISDKEILIKIRRGEIDFYTFMVKKYSKRIYNFISRKINKREDVEDLVQISFLQLYKAINRLDLTKPVLPYLYQIARNEMKMFWRKHKVTFPLNEEIVAEEKIELFDFDFLKKQLTKLNIEQKKALQLTSDGFSYKEIAKFLGKPINTIRTIIRRARLKLTKNSNDQTRK